MRHRKPAIYSIFITLIGAALLLMLSVTHAQEDNTFRIGVLDDIRGPISNGARLAVQQINSAGGVRGADGTLFRLELVIEPTNFGVNLEPAVIALDQAGVIAIIGPESNEVVANGLTTLQSLNIPVLVPAIGDTVLASDTTGRLFRVRAAEVWQGRALADYLVNTLNVASVATVQLDIASTAGVIGFSTASSALGLAPNPALLFETNTEMVDLVGQVFQADPQVLVAYGSPALASELYSSLRATGWQGVFAYPEAQDPIFLNTIPFDQIGGILSTTTWAFSATDPSSDAFLTSFVRAYGEVPHEVEAAAYDAVSLIAAAIAVPGELTTNIAALQAVPGVQGVLSPADLGGTDVSTNVAVVELGRFGAPIVLARYRDGVQLPAQTGLIPTLTPIPATPTPAGVVITITGLRQNIRTGPSVDYPIIGQLLRGEQAQVIGTSADNAWVVINFRGQQGWLATYLLEVFGDLRSVPIITPPPTPTPGVTPTPVPPPEADLIIQSVAVQPQPIAPGAPFTAVVTVTNRGNTPAGQFSVGSTFPPNNVFTSAVVGGLTPGQSITVNLQGTLTNTGFYTAGVLVDLNNQVPEGVTGEQNNTFNISYTVDVPLLRQGTQALNLGDTVDFEGDAVQGDANWNGDGGVGLDGIFGARLGILPGSDPAQIHWDLINPAVINRESIPRGELNAGTLIGVITADGRRAIARVDAVSDQQITLSWRVYSR